MIINVFYSAIRSYSRGAGARQCATERRGERARVKRNVFSLDLTAVIESLLTVLSVVSSKQPEQSIDNS